MRGWKDRVRRLTAGAGALVAGLALIVWGAAPASAGGPTSVLVVSPESGETASLYYSDAEYGTLERLLGPPGKGTRDKPPEADLVSGRMINVSWMVHDVTPWRVDRVFLGDIGADVWIHTSEKLTDTVNGRWHRAEDPTDLHKLLYELEVLGRTKASGAPAAVHPVPWESEAASGTAESGSGQDVAADREAAPAARAAIGTGWWWAIPGVVAGAALALVLRPYATRWPPLRRRPDDPGPRQELLDVR